MRPQLPELLKADMTKMTTDELRAHIQRLQSYRKKDLCQMLADEAEGKPEHEGFIYILSHHAMPGLLKIGSTVGPVEKRAVEIASSTGVPGPFRIEKKMAVYVRPRAVEKKVHRVLGPYRAIKNREFFRISVDEAVMFIQAVLDGKFDLL